MGSERMVADRKPECFGVAVVVYSVLTSLSFEADGCLDKLRSRKVFGMPAVEAGVHIRSVGTRDCYSHWRMQEGRVGI